VTVRRRLVEIQETKRFANAADGLRRIHCVPALDGNCGRDAWRSWKPNGGSNGPAAKSLGHDSHDFNGEEWRLLDENAEPLQINHSHLTVRNGDRRSASRLIIKQGEFAENAPDTDRFEDLAAQNYMHLPFRHGVHRVARLSLGEDGLPGLERSEVLLSFEDIDHVHGIIRSVSRDALGRAANLYSDSECIVPETIV